MTTCKLLKILLDFFPPDVARYCIMPYTGECQKEKFNKCLIAFRQLEYWKNGGKHLSYWGGLSPQYTFFEYYTGRPIFIYPVTKLQLDYQFTRSGGVLRGNYPYLKRKEMKLKSKQYL